MFYFCIKQTAYVLLVKVSLFSNRRGHFVEISPLLLLSTSARGYWLELSVSGQFTFPTTAVIAYQLCSNPVVNGPFISHRKGLFAILSQCVCDSIYRLLNQGTLTLNVISHSTTILESITQLPTTSWNRCACVFQLQETRIASC